MASSESGTKKRPTSSAIAGVSSARGFSLSLVVKAYAMFRLLSGLWCCSQLFPVVDPVVHDAVDVSPV